MTAWQGRSEIVVTNRDLIGLDGSETSTERAAVLFIHIGRVAEVRLRGTRLVPGQGGEHGWVMGLGAGSAKFVGDG